MLMTDQDHDGSHIKGLIINFIQHFWPKLLEHGSFLKEFVTPIIKATKGSEKISFFTLGDYDQWSKNNQKNYTIKYYKGLGTSTAQEAKEYFRDVQKHVISFKHSGREEENEAIVLAFSK
jgi:DNA topoisomerase-2